MLAALTKHLSYISDQHIYISGKAYISDLFTYRMLRTLLQLDYWYLCVCSTYCASNTIAMKIGWWIRSVCLTVCSTWVEIPPHRPRSPIGWVSHLEETERWGQGVWLAWKFVSWSMNTNVILSQIVNIEWRRTDFGSHINEGVKKPTLVKHENHSLSNTMPIQGASPHRLWDTTESID